MRIEEGFQQTPFAEANPYTTDPVLPSLLRRLLPINAQEAINADLRRFGERVITQIQKLGDSATPPSLTQYNQWGQRVDELKTSEAWRGLKRVSQSEGLVAIPYERVYGEYSRIYGFAKNLMMTGHSQVILCPLSMTDGCARVLELLGTPEMKRDIYSRIVSRDPDVAFTAGQWMTERPGGSDVSQTETTAIAITHSSGRTGSTYKLDGFKWFSSATDSDVSLVLARTGRPEDGSRSLSLFLVPLRLPLLREPGAPRPSNTSNGILVHRLKNKFGTQIVPTAELSLNGSEAYLLSPLNQGVKSIAPVLNITRIHSAIASVGYLRRCLAIATSYATVRSVHSGHTLLRDVPVHVAELAKVNLLYRALTHLVFGAIHLLGKTECGVATADEERRLRLLTPTVKAFAADKASTGMEECMTMLGGQGYMEENAFGRLIRDGLVEKIWEGTIVVLSLDLVRAAKDRTALRAFVKWGDAIIDSCPRDLHNKCSSSVQTLDTVLHSLPIIYADPIGPLVPRAALMLFAHVSSALYLLEHAIWSQKNADSENMTDVEVFARWVQEGGMQVAVEEVRRLMDTGVERTVNDKMMVFGHSTGTKVKL